MINSLVIEDSIRFKELGLQVNSNFQNVYDLEEILKSNYDYVYGYYVEKNLVAFIHVCVLYDTMDIVNIVVDKNYRKTGIASKLLNHVLELYKDVSNILLEVNEKNESAIALYKKYNFEVINKRNNYYGSDTALIMKRDVENERC